MGIVSRVSVVLVAAVSALRLLALAGLRPAEAAFPGTNGKIAFGQFFAQETAITIMRSTMPTPTAQG